MHIRVTRTGTDQIFGDSDRVFRSGFGPGPGPDLDWKTDFFYFFWFSGFGPDPESEKNKNVTRELDRDQKIHVRVPGPVPFCASQVFSFQGEIRSVDQVDQGCVMVTINSRVMALHDQLFEPN